MPKKLKRKLKVLLPLKLNFGAGNHKMDGYQSVDLYAPEADVRCDLFQFPLPWKDGSVDEIYSSHFVEHIPQKLRWPFFEECWRILKVGAVMKFFVPNWKSERAYGDMTHEWPPVTTMAFYYLNAVWRTANQLDYGPYALKCNFEMQAGPTGAMPEFAQKTQEVQLFAFTHYLESYPDMWVTLKKLEMPPPEKKK